MMDMSKENEIVKERKSKAVMALIAAMAGRREKKRKTRLELGKEVVVG